MRINPISVSTYPNVNKKTFVIKNKNQDNTTFAEQSFRGGLKLPDYIAGGICGTAFGIVVGTAIFPPLGILAGALAGKVIAEENMNSRPSDPNDKDD